MEFSNYQIESPDNFEQKSICCFIVDTSSSMDGSPINELNKGLQAFHADIQSNDSVRNKLEIAVIEFNSNVSVVVDPSLVKNFNMPSLSARGTTKMVDGINMAIEVVESRKSWYKETGQPYLRPWIILISDGAPDKDQDIQRLAQEIENYTRSKRFVFLPIGVQNADMGVLNQISGFYFDKSSWVKIPALKLDGLKFSDFFKWVSASMSIVASSSEDDSVNLPKTDWTEGFTI